MDKEERDDILSCVKKFQLRYMSTEMYDSMGQFIMLLPIYYDDGDGSCVVITPLPSGKWRVSDGGETAFHQMLTFKEIKGICDMYNLKCEDAYCDDQPPFECELYDIVDAGDEEQFGMAVQKIMQVICASYECLGRRSMVERRWDEVDGLKF